jgi:hypothetical protein
MTHANVPGPKSEHPVLPVSKGVSPAAKVLMLMALALAFVQGGFTVAMSGFGRQPPAEATKVQLPPQMP